MAGVSAAPYVRAQLAPPPGRTFVGAFLFVEDTYNYLGYVQQAEDGAFLFRSKLSTEPHRPALVNLEWWAAGRLSRVLGRRPLLAWRLLGLGAGIAFVALGDAWMRRAGLPATHRFPALLLVCFAAGPGGAISALGLARSTPIDLYTGLFPVIELLANPHFVIGTSLAMAALLALSHGSRRGTAAGVALAAVAGLTRPYDLVVIVAARGLAVAFTDPPRQWWRRILPLTATLPVVAYVYWVIHGNPAFAGFVAAGYPPPPVGRVLMALGPALALASMSMRSRADGREARAHLLAWVAVGLGVIILRPVPYALQFLAGIGMPLLALAAVALARFRPWATAVALAVLSSTPLVALWRMAGDDPHWFVPSARLTAARSLGKACGPGDVAMTPPEIGLYALAFAPCVPFVSHPAMSGYAERLAQARAFYGSWSAQERVEFLDRECVTVLLLPAGDAYTVQRREDAAPCARGPASHLRQAAP